MAAGWIVVVTVNIYDSPYAAGRPVCMGFAGITPADAMTLACRRAMTLWGGAVVMDWNWAQGKATRGL